MERHEIAKGMGLTLMGSLAKCGNTIFVRYAGENSVDVFEVLFMRSLFQVCIAVLNIIFTPKVCRTLKFIFWKV